MSDDIGTQRTRVHFFIEGRLSGKVKVRDFHRLGMYLWSDKRLREKACMSINLMEVDAENYFNRLIAIVQKTSNPSSDEVTEAVKELYEYITVLAEEIDGAGHFMPHEKDEPPLDWIETIRKTPDMIHELSAKMDKHDQDFLDMIIAVKDWMNKYGTVLDKINAEIDSGKARVQALDRR